MADFRIIKNYNYRGIDAYAYESTTFFGDYYRVVVNFKYNLFELWLVSGHTEKPCFKLLEPEKTLNLLRYKLEEFRFFSNCEAFIFDFCTYVRREKPTNIYITNGFAVTHDLEDFLKPS